MTVQIKRWEKKNIIEFKDDDEKKKKKKKKKKNTQKSKIEQE